MATIKLNDEVQHIDLPLTLSGLMELNRVLQPDMLSIQLNGVFVDRQLYDDTPLHEGDQVDFLYFMGGGR
jgi:sulfur carrier protein